MISHPEGMPANDMPDKPKLHEVFTSSAFDDFENVGAPFPGLANAVARTPCSHPKFPDPIPKLQFQELEVNIPGNEPESADSADFWCGDRRLQAYGRPIKPRRSLHRRPAVEPARELFGRLVRPLVQLTKPSASASFAGDTAFQQGRKHLFKTRFRTVAEVCMHLGHDSFGWGDRTRSATEPGARTSRQC
jgi:hypothetical protein